MVSRPGVDVPIGVDSVRGGRGVCGLLLPLVVLLKPLPAAICIMAGLGTNLTDDNIRTGIVVVAPPP